jgi:uncharacterized protein YecA (UPF0149 family)
MARTTRRKAIVKADTDLGSPEGELDEQEEVETTKRQISSELAERLASIAQKNAKMFERKGSGRPLSPTAWRHRHCPGRNEPCPCGSGKKHNKCCGAE